MANGAQNIVLSGFSTGGAHAMSFLPAAAGGRDRDAHGCTERRRRPDRRLRRQPKDPPGAAAPVPPTLSTSAKFITSLRIGVNWKLLDYIADADETIRQPVLIHHGTADLRIPLETSLDLQATNPDLIQLITVEGAGHVESYDVDRESYVDQLVAFSPTWDDLSSPTVPLAPEVLVAEAMIRLENVKKVFPGTTRRCDGPQSRRHAR